MLPPSGVCTQTSDATVSTRRAQGSSQRLPRVTHSLLQGNLDEAERYLKQALREARRAFDSKDAHVAAALNNLAEVYRC